MAKEIKFKKVVAKTIHADTIVAKNVLVEDKDGNARRISLGSVKDGPCILMYDQKKQMRISLSVDREGEGSICLFDRGGKERLRTSISNNNPTIVLSDRIGQERLRLTVRHVGDDSVYDVPLIWVFDIDGKPARELASLPDDFPLSDSTKESE